MKIIVERDAFADAVGAAKHAVDRSLRIPILANVLLRVNGASLEVAATNLDMRIESAIPADIVDRSPLDAITVPVAVLSDLASRMQCGARLTLQWDENSKNVSLSAGRARYQLHALPASDFPVLPHPDDAVGFSVPGKALADALNMARWATYGGIDRAYIAGVHAHLADNQHVALGNSKTRKLVFAATDGGHLARVTVEMPRGAEAMPAITIPNAALGEIARIASGTDGNVYIDISPIRLAISNGRSKFLTKLLDTTFPDYHAVIPDVEDARMLVDIDALRGALMRLKALAEDRRVRAEIAAGSFKLSLNADKGQAEEIVEVEFESDDLLLSLNSTDILSIINHIDADTCLFRFRHSPPNAKRFPITVNPMKASVIDYDRTFLTMPMER